MLVTKYALIKHSIILWHRNLSEIGIHPLFSFLQEVIRKHISSTLPKLIKRIWSTYRWLIINATFPPKLKTYTSRSKGYFFDESKWGGNIIWYQKSKREASDFGQFSSKITWHTLQFIRGHIRITPLKSNFIWTVLTYTSKGFQLSKQIHREKLEESFKLECLK